MRGALAPRSRTMWGRSCMTMTRPFTAMAQATRNEAVKPPGTLRLDVVQGSVDAPSDRFPVNTHILGDGASGQVCGRPPHSKVKVLCKAAARVSPWDICDKHAMFQAFNAVRVIRYFNKSAAPVQPPPDTWLRVLLVVASASLMAERAVILVPYIRSGMDEDMVNTIPICIEIASPGPARAIRPSGEAACRPWRRCWPSAGSMASTVRTMAIS